MTFLLCDGNMNPVDQFTTDQNGYAYIDTLELSGKVYLRELENEGYIVDEQLKTVYIKPGETTEITWKTGPSQARSRLSRSPPTTTPPTDCLLEHCWRGPCLEIYDKAGNLVDTIRSDSRGLAVSKPLPLSRYTIREVKAPANYGVNETELTAYLEHEGQIVKFEVTNKSLTTGVSITKTGPKEIMAGQPVRYTFSGIANSSNVRWTTFIGAIPSPQRYGWTRWSPEPITSPAPIHSPNPLCAPRSQTPASRLSGSTEPEYPSPERGGDPHRFLPHPCQYHQAQRGPFRCCRSRLPKRDKADK